MSLVMSYSPGSPNLQLFIDVNIVMLGKSSLVLFRQGICNLWSLPLIQLQFFPRDEAQVWTYSGNSLLISGYGVCQTIVWRTELAKCSSHAKVTSTYLYRHPQYTTTPNVLRPMANSSGVALLGYGCSISCTFFHFIFSQTGREPACSHDCLASYCSVKPGIGLSLPTRYQS